MKSKLLQNRPSINYIIICSPKDAVSSASINRITCFQKGLQDLGYRCTLNRIYSSLIRFRGLSKFCFIIFYIRLIILLIKSKRGDYFIFYGESPFGFLFKYFRKKVKVIVERNEYPSYMINQQSLSNNFIHYCKKFEFSLQNIDGFITCSDALKKYYKKFLNPLAESVLLPLIVDVKLFNSIKKNNTQQKYIAYCGNYGNNKDGISILIESFAMIAGDYPNLKLYLIGGGDFYNEQKLRKDIFHLKIEEKVIFIGQIPHNKVPPILCNAKLLALSRPSTKQAEGGIPSKVGEYLACGVPFVVTRVGELNKFLNDGENCYMSKPNSATDFANKIRQALNDKNSQNVAQNGLKTVSQFSIENQTQLLTEFLRKI